MTMRLSRGSRLSKGFSPKRMRRFVDRFGRHESEEDKEITPRQRRRVGWNRDGERLGRGVLPHIG